MASDSDPSILAPHARPGAPELRLLDRRAFVGFPAMPVAPGLVIADFALQIPDVSFPFNVSAGPTRYQRKKLHFGFLELTLTADLVARRVAEVASRLAGLEDLRLHFRPGYLEAQARLQAPERTPLTFKLAFDGDGERLAVYLYDVRLYGFSSTPSVQVPGLISSAVASLGLLPEVELRGASGFSARVLPALCQLAAVSRGYKMPELDSARLSAAEVSGAGLRLRFTAGGLPPPAPPDEELLLTLEGARAFADAEALVAQGKLAEAREAYLRAGDVQDAHPFAAERLLSLLVADPQAHDLALDVAGTLLRRRERSAAALWGEAVVRERRGEHARAAERFLALSALSRRASEEAGAFFAAEAAARSARDQAPQMAVKALHELLGLRPDHLPSLQALARASDQARDRAGAVRAYRRIAALARDPQEAAEAHVRLARLCAQTEDDVAGARLHCEAALRLSPDLPDALLLLGELCHRAGEHLRALKALDRLREVGLARHELDRVGQANLLAGRVWEEGLGQLDNALLRYREAASLLPGEPEPLFCAARVAEGLGKVQEALAGYQQTLELAGPAPRTEAIRAAAHASHHALARLSRGRLADPARAREHLEAALALDPRDAVALEELIPYFRATGRAPELAGALEKAAAVQEESARRAVLWAEAGELYRGRLQQPDKAERLLTSALEADAENRPALESLLSLAEAKRDGGQLTRCLGTLARLTAEPKERAQKYRRLAVAARDLAFDLELATHALLEVLKAEPDDLSTLGELCALQRKRSDMAGLATALESRARVAEHQGDKRLAAAALRELAGVLEARLGRVGEALVALEKAARLAPDAGVLLDLADLSLRCERPEHARRALESLLSSLPRSAAPERLAEVRVRLGRACELLGDREGAIAAYAQALPLRRLDDVLATRLEALYTEVGDGEALSELWATRAQALVAAERREEASPLLLKSARALLDRGEKAAALVRLHAALEAHPEGPGAANVLELMAALELERGEKLEAAKLHARRAALVEVPREAARLLLEASELAAGTAREEALLAEALEQDPSFAPARMRRAQLRLPTDPRGALQDLEAVLALPEDDVDAPGASERVRLTRLAGQAAGRAGRAEIARRWLTRYCEAAPDDVEAKSELAALHRASGAREALADLLAELWPHLEGEGRTAARRELAELSLALGRRGPASEALRSLLRDEPRNPWATGALLSLLPPAGSGSAEEEDERLELLGTLIEGAQGAGRGDLLAQRGALHRSAGRLAEARADFSEAVELTEPSVPLLLALAELARGAGDEEGELATWQRLLARLAGGAGAPPSEKVAAGWQRALAQGSRGGPSAESELEVWKRALSELARADDGAAGLSEYRRATASGGPSTAAARERLLALGASLLEKDARALAREAIEAAVTLELSADERCDALFQLASLARREGSPDEEARALARAARQGSVARRVEALLARGHLLAAGGDLAGAAESLETALGLAPRHPEAMELLQRVLRGLGRWDALAALLASEAEQERGVEGAALHAELATLYLEKLASAGQAEAALRKALQLDPGAPHLRERLVALVQARGAHLEAAGLLAGFSEGAEPQAAAALLREGAASARQGADLDLALKLARRAHALVPAEGAALSELAELLYLRGAVAEALPLQRALASALDFAMEPDRAQAELLRLGDLAEQTGERALAESAYRRLLAERPLCEDAAARLAALLEREHPRAALDVLVAHARALPASQGTALRLVELSKKARASVADVELAASLLSRAAAMAEEPLPLHRALVALYRESGRVAELMAALVTVGALALGSGDLAEATAAYAEEARLAEEMGRADEALKTLEALRDILVESAQPGEAALHERRRAELLRDVKLDLSAAGRALERSFELAADLGTARLGVALSARRADPAAEARWLERALSLEANPREQGALQLQLARLHLGPLNAPDRAEGFLRDALRRDRVLSEAERLLCALLEREGRVAELAAWYEECAGEEQELERRSQLLQRAAALYRDRAGRPELAAVALLAARAATPDDAGLTSQAADLLHEVGRSEDAAAFDQLLLERDPFREPSFTRHQRYLEATGDHQLLATLMLWRAERQEPAGAAESYLAAARAFRAAGALERAQLCEDQAFERAPQNRAAFELVRARATWDARQLADLLAERAEAVPAERVALLRERADLLLAAGESLLAAEAFDALLAEAGDDVPALSARAELAAAAGGPLAAQPYDRRLLRAAGESLALAVRLRTQLRLGHASLASGAFHDAAEAFDAVAALDPEGPRGEEALSLLAEVHGRSGNAPGLYRASLELARRAEGPTAEALYRRAAELFADPREALDALVPLARLRPADARVIDRAAAGLRAAGRHGELLSVYEAGAEAAGGARAAELLLAAAQVARAELADEDKAWELQGRAREADPTHLEALRARLEGARRRGAPVLREALEELAVRTQDSNEASLLRLELAALSRTAGETSQAISALEAVVARGAAGAGYAEALEALEPLLVEAPVRLAEVLEARAALVTGEAAAELLGASARAFEAAGSLEDSLRVAKAAAAAHADVDSLILLATLHEKAGDAARAAQAVLLAARLAPDESRPELLLKAADLWERAEETAEALEALERIASEYAGAVSSAELSERFLRLGAPAKALEVGFAPALERGEVREALALAQRAGDATRVDVALWQLVELESPAEEDVQLLAERLRSERRFEDLLELADALGTKRPEAAGRLREEVLHSGAPGEVRRAAFEALREGESFGRQLVSVFDGLERAPEPLVDSVLAHVRGLGDAERRAALTAVAERWPGRRAALLLERFELERDGGHLDEACGTLEQLIGLATDARARAALAVERGELLLLQGAAAGPPGASVAAARESFERALRDDADSLPAVLRLLGLYEPSRDAARFVAVAERKQSLTRAGWSEAEQSQLVEAYEALSRDEDALALLSRLPETRERLTRREALATRLGRTEEALGLRERLADSTPARGAALDAYLEAGLIPHAARLTAQMRDAGALTAARRERAAAVLGAHPESARLACELWTATLREAPLREDAWTSYAEALTTLELGSEAERAIAFAAALAGTRAAAPEVAVRSAPPAATRFFTAAPAAAREVTAEGMPRLHRTLDAALEQLGAAGTRLLLEPRGGIEAYLTRPGELVLGAGALALLGPGELVYLCALALCLGEAGRALTEPGPVPGLEAAAVEAFRCVPSPLAAARVLARIAPDVRGSEDAARRDAPPVTDNPLFGAVALAALEGV